MAKSAEYGLGEYAFPRGWFAVAESTEIGRKPYNVHYFGQDMVLYRGESGKVVMLEAYCPHMGTHLGMSETSATVVSGSFLEGDSIRCPFHAWRFGPDGKCNHIPYFSGPIPEKARLRSWPLEERYGIVFCWHDPEQLPPDFELPHIPQWDDPSWVRWQTLDHLADLQHPIEIFDNTSDIAHLTHLHGGGGVSRYENEIRGHFFYQRETQGADVADVRGKSGNSMTTLGRYVGPGMLFSHFVEANAIQLICHTPIEDGQARLWQACMLKSPTGKLDDTARAAHQRFRGLMCGGLMKDAEVWKHKRAAIQIMQLPSDGPFRQSRVWYSQFYNPRDKAAAIISRVEGKHFARGTPEFGASAAPDP
jgi:3-ketosteroid 9alpha-monooxygenase subunit A